MVKNVLIKVSGDVSDNSEFFDFTVKKAKKNYTAVICGGGTQANQALKNAGYKINYSMHGRVTETWIERKIVRDVLEAEEKKLQDKFVGKGIVVIAPLLYAGSVLCHINGDSLIKSYYLGFDEIYVFTLKERSQDKQKVFKDFPKVKIIGV